MKAIQFGLGTLASTIGPIGGLLYVRTPIGLYSALIISQKNYDGARQ